MITCVPQWVRNVSQRTVDGNATPRGSTVANESFLIASIAAAVEGNSARKQDEFGIILIRSIRTLGVLTALSPFLCVSAVAHLRRALGTTERDTQFLLHEFMLGSASGGMELVMGPHSAL